MANFKRKKCRRQVKCTLCTPNKWKGNAKGKGDKCIVCKTALTKEGGYENTDMCGPCATGESDTINEIGRTW